MSYDKGVPFGAGFDPLATPRWGEMTVYQMNAHCLVWNRWVPGVDNPAYLHDFFGKMTREQIGIFAFKLMDHHLRQFGGLTRRPRRAGTLRDFRKTLMCDT